MFITRIHIPAENALVPRLINICGWLQKKEINFTHCDAKICGSGISVLMTFAREPDAFAVADKFEGKFGPITQDTAGE